MGKVLKLHCSNLNTFTFPFVQVLAYSILFKTSDNATINKATTATHSPFIPVSDLSVTSAV